MPGPSPSFIINADDFGWTPGQNLAVEQAHLAGVLTRASLLCNGPAFDEAVAISRRLPRLGVGIHLTLSEGRPLLPPGRLPGLLRADGSFHDRLLPLFRLFFQDRQGRLEGARAEWRAQIERALQAGVRVTHLDSHKHVHLLPPLLEAVIALATEYGVPYVRLPLPPLGWGTLRRGPGGLGLLGLALRARPRLERAGLRFADHFVGFGESGAMTGRRLAQVIREARDGTTEIMVHPAVPTPEVAALGDRYGWARRYRFAAELEALCDEEVRELLQGGGGDSQAP